MIAINVFAELFDWDEKTTERTQRAYSVSRSLYTMARVGKAGASPLIFVEAAMAFLDALGAYADYRQAKSKTRELEAEGQALAQGLKELEKQFRVQAQVRDLKISAQMSAIREQLVERDMKLSIGVAQLEILARQIKKLGEHIALQRLDSTPNCVPLLKLERAYYQLVDAQLSTALTLVDE
ncbi:hypothetical protein IPC29_06605 [Pseudomonas aeruginosa]|uniref:hypothetical protein n=1 Tax=Pseudomonas aeruginosa TaxID=287 RepID=UPI000D00A96B|nr:hypothetical protein [Pseudomonas aeruginosa]EKX3431166.1 hypothetical protein [Pseudomonas aeruginosa]MBX5576810.1 hypothetical protein [Pseudomonas aeruginosa]MCQ9732360.1 hypothetical protein [Pseudomonas aeruginosa]MCS8237056.1 hypothetical protein [Pseudomonas aeruginosa]MCT0306755.1 hypothetical protein [Pseudomonas aeruginosa]